MPSTHFNENDRKFMQKALNLAESVKGTTGDNPAVGAVIYKKNRILGVGKTNPPGLDHAEKEAIKNAGRFAKGATLAVTLEPCCYTGRTGSCIKSIIDTKIKRVIVAVKDPNPKVNGKGIRELKKAGIKVDIGLNADKACAINEDFFKFIKTKMPFVTLKAALTLNGLIAASSYNSKWISSLNSRRIAHNLRANNDAILVGLNTVKHDNPLLTVRHVKGKNPLRIVLSDGLDIPYDSRLARTAGKIKTYIVTPRQIKRPCCNYAEYIVLYSKDNKINLKTLLKMLGKLGIKSLLVEGGSEVYTSFIEQKCVDIFYLFFSNKLLTNGIPFINGVPSKSIKGAINLKEMSLKPMENDFLVRAKSGY